MSDRNARLNWIEAQMMKADFVSTDKGLDQLQAALTQDIDDALYEVLISLGEHDDYTRRAAAVIEDRREALRVMA